MAFNKIYSNWAWAVMPSILILLGHYLAEEMTSQNVSVSFAQNRFAVGGVHVLKITYFNNSDVAIDRMLIKNPDQNVLTSSFDPPSVNTNSQNYWSGKLLKHAVLETLYISNREISVTEQTLKSFASAQYETRREDDGELILKSVPFHEGGNIFVSKTIIYLLWYLGPVTVPFLIYGLWTLAKHKFNRPNSGTVV